MGRRVRDGRVAATARLPIILCSWSSQGVLPRLRLTVVKDFAYVDFLDTCKDTRATRCRPCPTGIKSLGLGYVGHPHGCLRLGLGRGRGQGCWSLARRIYIWVSLAHTVYIKARKGWDHLERKGRDEVQVQYKLTPWFACIQLRIYFPYQAHNTLRIKT